MKRKRRKQVRRRSPVGHDQVRAMASAGLVEDQIALRINGGMHKNQLRRKYIDDIKEGRAVAKAAREEAEAAAKITKEEYHALDAMTLTFASHWFDDKHGNLLFPGTNGDGARTVEDAFAAWKADGGKYNCTGLSNIFDKKKYAAYSKIVSAYRQKLNSPRRPARITIVEE